MEKSGTPFSVLCPGQRLFPHKLMIFDDLSNNQGALYRDVCGHPEREVRVAYNNVRKPDDFIVENGTLVKTSIYDGAPIYGASDWMMPDWEVLDKFMRKYSSQI